MRPSPVQLRPVGEDLLDEEHGVSIEARCRPYLPFIHHEVLHQDGNVCRLARQEMTQVTGEPGGLGEHGKGGRTPGEVRTDQIGR